LDWDGIKERTWYDVEVNLGKIEDPEGWVKTVGVRNTVICILWKPAMDIAWG